MPFVWDRSPARPASRKYPNPLFQSPKLWYKVDMDKACHLAYKREYTKRPAQRLRLAAARRVYGRRNPLKIGARKAVYRAKRSGRLFPGACCVCGMIEGVEAHHYRGYAREHWLDVEWLCREHHRRTP